MIGRIAILTLTSAALFGCSPNTTEERVTDVSADSLDRVYEFTCGPTTVKTVYHGQDTMTLHLDGREITLVPTVSASGARYETAPGINPTIVFWNRGNEATLEREGMTTLQCYQTEGPRN